MSARRRCGEGGQALIMVTVALVAMSGLIGMAVDFGWSFFVHKSEQAAADAAALAAAHTAWQAFTSGNSDCHTSPFSCADIHCDSSPTGTLGNACDYARQNGFSGAAVRVTEDICTSGCMNPVPHSPPTVPGVTVYYWATVRISNTIPQLYSAVLGNPNATVSARATAAVAQTIVVGSLIALNRQGETLPNGPTDVNVGGTLNAPKGITIASKDAAAGVGGTVTSNAPTLLRYGAGVTWSNVQHQYDGPSFTDPLSGMGQPPLGNSLLPLKPVPGGTDWSVCGNPPSCPPGIYFATSNNVASGAPLTIGSNLNFSNSGNFGDYIFLGGLNINASVSFGIGRYVLAGVSNPATNYNLNFDSNSTINGGSANDAGRLFISTDTTYPGLNSQLAQIAPQYGPLPQLQFGQTVFNSAGAGAVTLYGLNPAQSSQYPTESANAQNFSLKDFAPLVFWQDQRFSTVQYNADGTVDTTCGSLDSPCTRTPPVDPAVKVLKGSNMSVSGAWYQPRGAWTKVQGTGTTLSGQLQLITGALQVDTGSSVMLVNPPLRPLIAWHPFVRRLVALVE